MGDWDWCVHTTDTMYNTVTNEKHGAAQGAQWSVVIYMGRKSKKDRQCAYIYTYTAKTNTAFKVTFRCCCSVTQSCLTLQSYGLQHARPPCPSPTPGAYSDSCPLSQWCHPAISSSVVPFSSCLQTFPASGSFLVSLFTSGGKSIEASASPSVFPISFQDFFSFRIDWLDLLVVQGTLKCLLQHYN